MKKKSTNVVCPVNTLWVFGIFLPYYCTNKTPISGVMQPKVLFIRTTPFPRTRFRKFGATYLRCNLSEFAKSLDKP